MNFCLVSFKLWIKGFEWIVKLFNFGNFANIVNVLSKLNIKFLDIFSFWSFSHDLSGSISVILLEVAFNVTNFIRFCNGPISSMMLEEIFKYAMPVHWRMPFRLEM